MSELLSDSALFAIIGSSLVTLSAAGFLPKLGMGRAVVLGLKSVAKSLRTKSIRHDEVQKVRNDLSNLSSGCYLVVTGPKDVGKTCLVSTALHRRFGVTTIDVSLT